MKYLNARLFALALACISPSLAADTLTIPVGQQSSPGVTTELPGRGLSTAAVLQRHGDPVARHAPVGNPPISRWDYEGFSVYFEAGAVVHSVLQHRPRGS